MGNSIRLVALMLGHGTTSRTGNPGQRPAPGDQGPPLGAIAFPILAQNAAPSRWEPFPSLAGEW